MAEKCIVTIKEEQQHQQQCPSPLGEIKNDSVTALTGTPTTIITSSIPSATTAISLPSTTTVSASSTPTQSGTIDCDDDDQEENGGKPREKGCYAWFYSTNHGVVVGHSTGNQIHLETPALEEKSNGGMNLAKPKRLSDEFYSADDDYDEDDDDEMIGGGEDGGIGISSSSSGSSSLTGISKSVGGDGDCEAHASLNEIKNLSITNGGAELGEDRYEQDENSISDPIYISEETSSCSSGHQRIIAEEASVKAQETEEPSRQHPEQPLGMEQEEIPEDEGDAALEDNLEDDEDDEVDEDDPHDVQSIDAIERRDFEQEQKLTGGIIIKNSALIPDNHRLNLEVINSFSRNRNDALAKKSQSESGKVQLITTPTSSRHAYKNCCNNPSSSNSTSNREQNSNSTTKSTVKVNLSASLDSYCAASESVNGPDMADGPSCSSSMASSSSSSASSSSKTHNRQQQQQLDAIFNSNSNDSLSSDRSIFIPNLQALKASAKDCPTAPSSSGVNEPGTSSSSSSSPSPSSASCSAGPSTSGATKAPSDCSLSSCATSVIKQTGECSKNINHHPIPSTSTSSSSLFSFSCPFGSADRETGEGCSNGNVSLRRFPSNGSNFADNIADEVEPSSSSHRIRQPQLHHEHNHMEDPLLEPSELSMPPELAASASVVDHECDEDNWADCEEGSDEEICTCRDYTDDEGNGTTGAGGHASSEDELPSRDVDLSSFTHMDAAEDILAHDPSTGGSGSAANTSGNNAQTPRLHRKRKLTENRILFGSGGSRTSTGGMSETTGGLGSHCDSPSTESLNYNSRKRLALDSTSSPRTVRSPSNVSS